MICIDNLFYIMYIIIIKIIQFSRGDFMILVSGIMSILLLGINAFLFLTIKKCKGCELITMAQFFQVAFFCALCFQLLDLFLRISGKI